MLSDLDKMLGAVCGDVCGSIYEWNNIKYKLDEDELITPVSQFTDDSVMTIAVAEGISNSLEKLSQDWMDNIELEGRIYTSIQKSMLKFGRQYAYVGYGGGFLRWLESNNPMPYGSCGNGSAMRASYAGWAAKSLGEAERLAEISARVTHNHPDGINGAKVVAGSIYLLRNGGNKQIVREYVSKIYNLDFSLDEIRDEYTFDVLCRGSVPQAVVAFLEGSSFADVISNAISIGGDSDTIAAIAGSIAEALYQIPDNLKNLCVQRLENNLRLSLINSIEKLKQ